MIAIILLLTVYPFAIAIVSSAGADQEGRFQSTILDNQGLYAQGVVWDTGGVNMTSSYDDGTLPQYMLDKCYIENGIANETTQTNDFYINLGTGANTNFFMPYVEQLLQPMPYFCSLGATNGAGYMGSGDYSWYYPANAASQPLKGINQSEAIDKLKFNFVDRFNHYHTTNAIFTNLTYQGEITFFHDNESLTFTDFEFESDNKYCYDAWDQQHSTWNVQCAVGFDVVFDFDAFESLELDSFNQGEWNETGFLLTLTNFERTDGVNLGGTALPWNSDGNFYSFGIEHQPMNRIMANFMVRLGTLVLTVLTFALAIGSTPYWDPLKNAFRGAI